MLCGQHDKLSIYFWQWIKWEAGMDVSREMLVP